MGVITISLDNDTEKKLRTYATMHYGTRKDALSKTIIQAMSRMEERQQEEIEKLKVNMTLQKTERKIKKIPQTRAEYYER